MEDLKNKRSEQVNNFDISIISDPHVLAPKLMGDSENFRKELKIERKLVVESEGLFKKALDLVDKAGSTSLILPGDLVKEGEYESHKLVSNYLSKWKQKDPKRNIFLIPGNHDINNHRAYDYKKDMPSRNISPGEFFKLYDFIYEDDSIMEFYKDSPYFKTYLEEINKTYQRKYQYSYYGHGYFSYLARIKKDYRLDNGLSIIMLDTAIYSADKEENHRDGRENIAGSVSLSQMKWLVEKIDEAKKRKDMIMVVAHHAFLPNFRNQDLVLSPFLIKEWKDKFNDPDPRIDDKSPIEVLADNGVKFLFTGHLHENGTAKYKSENGSIIYDIQTGSTITYPLPIRHLAIENKSLTNKGFEVFVKTELINDFSFKDQFGQSHYIDNAMVYTMQNQLSLKEVIDNYIKIQANNPLLANFNYKEAIIDIINSKFDENIPYEGYMNQVVFPKIAKHFPLSRKFIGRIYLSNYNNDYEIRIRALANTFFIKAENIEAAIDIILDQAEEILSPDFVIEKMIKISEKIWSMPIDKDHSFYDFANYIYQYRSTDGEKRPLYVEKMIDNINNPDYNIIDILIDYAGEEIDEYFDLITDSILLKKNGSKQKFFRDLIQIKGLPGNLFYSYFIRKVTSLRDLLDFFSRFITRKPEIRGVDLAKRIVHSRAVRMAKMNISDKMFGQKSLRKFLLGLIGEINDDMSTIYQNANLNELDHYFNYVEYDQYQE
ncbi:MAG: metallophosphoesterase [Anaerococcus sp.]|nr:metallophosphoesterase [Anaerococcus sp.]